MDAELALFVRDEHGLEQARSAAWILHGRAHTPSNGESDEQIVSEAAAVAAHTFDLWLQLGGSTETTSEQLRHIVAAQSAYHVAGLAPNAMAIGARFTAPTANIEDAPGLTSLVAARALLGLSLTRRGEMLDTWQPELVDLSEGWGDLEASPYAAVGHVLRGIEGLRDYLLEGAEVRLDLALDAFASAIDNPYGSYDTDSRWVAALLTDFGSIARNASVWAILPPETPQSVGRALLLGDPPVTLLWPPQVDFLAANPSPFDPATRRMVLSLPTSAGKTLMAQIVILHMVASEPRDVCFIAPTHALCREVAESLNSRLAFLGTHAVDASLGNITTTNARVVVTTPERFATMLRTDVAGVLERFGTVVVDEVHLLAEAGRGWRLEETLTLLHHLTSDSDHRVILISAALGNTAHFRQWVELDRPPLSRSTRWRGPRRLHALYSTEFEGDFEIQPAQGRRLARRTKELVGTIWIRRPDGVPLKGYFEGSAGKYVQRQTRTGDWTYESTASTKQILRLLPLLEHLLEDQANNVLVVVAMRREARELAEAIASRTEPTSRAAGLAARLRSRLGDSDPLASMVQHGVAYHHGLLPNDVQADLEAGAARGTLRCIVATTTLTEGVNLPFKSVVVASTGWGSGDERVEVIDPPRLMNALGRAGRACKESEGWLFLAFHERFHTGLFDQFTWSPSDRDFLSRLATSEVLEQVAAFEEAQASGIDALITSIGSEIDEFCSYIWLISDLLLDIGATSDLDSVLNVLQSTLAWQQLNAEDKARWSRVAATSRNRYDSTSTATRRRWGRSGLGLPSNSSLSGMVQDLVDELTSQGVPTTRDGWLSLLFTEDRLSSWLSLPENPAPGPFKPYRSAPRSKSLDVDYQVILSQWIAGADLADIGEEALSGIRDEDYRADALSEWVAGALEHHLPMVVSLTLGWTSEQLPAVDLSASDPIPAMLRFGVDSLSAIAAMSAGVRSRRLANRIGASLGDTDVAECRRLLRAMTIEQWRSEFDASPSELADLLAFVSDPSEQLVDVLLDAGRATVPVEELDDDLEVDTAVPVDLDVAQVGGVGERDLRIGGRAVARIPAAHLRHIDAVMRLGLRVSTEIVKEPPDFEPRLAITLAT